MLLVGFSTGLLFGMGLLLSGMTDPVKVLGFLDVAGSWDPSLALVMVGGVGIAILPFQLVAGRRQSWLGFEISSADKTRLDGSLLIGSALFGIGWGIGGFCPGPALVGMIAGYLPAIVFVIAMLFGMEIYQWMIEARMRRQASQSAA